MCNKCNEPCSQPDCACSTFLSTDCITLSEDLTCTNIIKGQTETEVLKQLDAYICERFTSVENFFQIINVGGGSEIYKGITVLGKKELRTLVDSNLINLVQGTDTITISVDETVLNTFIEANQKTYSAANVGTGAQVYKNSTVVGDNTQFNLRKIKSSDNSVTITEGVDDINMTIPDATASVKGVLKLTNDLGGTADLPTTPTALHKTTNESWTGVKSSTNTGASSINGISLTNSGTGTSASLNVNVTGSGRGINMTVQNGGGKAINIDDFNQFDNTIVINKSTTSGDAIVVNSGGNNRGLFVNNTGIFDGVYSYNTVTGNAFRAINDGTGAGLHLTNNSGGNGITLLNQTTGKGIVLSNNSTSFGIYIDNANATGIGLFVDTYLSGSTGAKFNNTSTNGIALNITNSSTGGIGLAGKNQSTGVLNSFDSATGSTGDLIQFTKNNILQSKFNQNGRYSITGGTASQYLMADGSTSTIDGSETKIVNGTNTTITGNGTIATPYQITVPTIDGSETKVQAGTGTTVTGTGTVANPYVINATASGIQVAIITGGWSTNNGCVVSTGLGSGKTILNIVTTMICTVTNNGYAVGDIVNIQAAETDDSGGLSDSGVTVRFRADVSENFTFNVNNRIDISNCYNGSVGTCGALSNPFQASPAQWDIRNVIYYI